MMRIPVQILSPEAKLPSQARKGDAGYDLMAIQSIGLSPGQRYIFKTGMAMAIPDGYYGRIADRSGLAAKKGIHVLAGVIDAGYRGEIGVVLINLSDQTQTILAGDKIAQMVIEKCHDVEWETVDSLDETQRGVGGFGSTDKPLDSAKIAGNYGSGS